MLGNNLDPLSKTWLLCIGAFILISVVWGPQIVSAPVTFDTVKWAFWIAIFSMVFPLVAYSIFMQYWTWESVHSVLAGIASVHHDAFLVWEKRLIGSDRGSPDIMVR